MSAAEMHPPAFLRVQQPTDPVGAVTEDDAAQRTAAYPKIRIGAHCSATPCK
ncbi:hypothetical protein ACGFIE_00930 [Micromonospora sp. NPDC049275]|uniref:hypothetical protein n=1 Tax=Micromonospora sp. NPDC049275 TaxID=3364268 RepID=UPI003719ACB9